MINGLVVLMDPETRQWTETVTIDVNGQILSVKLLEAGIVLRESDR